jgi:exodeoxyribonuclease V beta subunit
VAFAFESGEPFEVSFTEDARELYAELCQDHWAARAYEARAGWLSSVQEIFAGPDSFLDLVKRAAERPDLRVLPELAQQDEKRQQARLRALLEPCAKQWRRDQATIRQQLDYGNGVLKAGYKQGKIVAPLAALDALLTGPPPRGPRVPAGTEKFAASALRGATKARKTPPSHPFFAAWDRYVSLAQELLLNDIVALQRELFELARPRLDARKDARNVRAYSDLLVRLAESIEGPGSDALADAIFARYPAALIDEFQDTDPIQFAIFQRAFHGGRGTLFLIGDPKQAIYAFRGGDIYAYLRAVQGTHRTTLGTNYRADDRLVEALGVLYGRAGQAFVDPRIPFHPVGAHHGPRIRGPSDEPEPLQIRMIEVEGKGKRGRITGTWAAKGLVPAIASDVVRFLGSDAKLQRGEDARGRPVWSGPRPSDVAVLVRRNMDAAAMQDALLALGVHSVVATDKSVFGSAEAAELWTVLQAVLHPASDRLLRVAATSRLLGLTGTQLAALVADDARWAGWAERCRGWRDTWEQRGFMAMFRAVLLERLEPDVIPAQERVLGWHRGERAMTNLLHLGELLQRESQRRSLGPAGLVSWFAQRRAGVGDGSDDEELRLESDADAATIMTVYKAKGLQWPVVWAPFGHITFRVDEVRPLFHGEPPAEVATVSLEPYQWGEQSQRAREEQLAQERRVLYVTLTRAAHRLIVYWGDWYERDDSALAALLHPPPGMDDETDPTRLLAAGKAHAKGMREHARMSEIERVAQQNPGLIGVRWLDETPASPLEVQRQGGEDLQLATFDGRVRTSWRRTSYTGLTRGAGPGAAPADPTDHDEQAEEAMGVAPSAKQLVPLEPLVGDDMPAAFQDYPRGRHTGVLLHSVFEHADFQDSGEALDGVVNAQLEAARLDVEALGPTTAESIRRILETPLGGGLGGFTLGDLPRTRRIDELPFTFPISRRGQDTPNLRQRDLVAFLRQQGRAELAARVERLSFGRLRGHLMGFVDLIFEQGGRHWVVDYKSNFLGPTVGDYHRAALAEAVAHHNYDLQYLVYCVALHRHLELRLPGYRFSEHFGGVRYLFVRGMGPDSGAARGVFADEPSEALVVGLSELFRQPGEVAP